LLVTFKEWLLLYVTTIDKVVCACPIYIRIPINTLKVLIVRYQTPRFLKYVKILALLNLGMIYFKDKPAKFRVGAIHIAIEQRQNFPCF
jgi:predicted CDP-diglyceride synthetase/phosphatidate cytidylyltransferase